MVRFLLSTFAFALMMLSCHHKSSIMSPPEPEVSANRYTYLALGDSYTIGESVSNEERYPVLLSKQLQTAGVPIAEPVIIATTGWSTGDLQAGIERRNLQDTFSMVSLLIGVNNQYRNLDFETYKKQFSELLNQAVAFAGGRKERVFVVSIPDYSVTPFAAGRNTAQIAQEIDAYNAANAAITRAAGIVYFDITPISRQAPDDPALIASDGLHPSGKMYRAWADLMFPTVRGFFP